MPQRDNASHETHGHFAAVNGVNLYYEIHGAGAPLVLLHGGLGTNAMWGDALLSALAATRQVIAVELYGHGHTALSDRPMTFEDMADDIAALVQHLGMAQVDVMGYSLGGGVALQTALRHPAIVRKVILISATGKRQGWHTESLAGMAAVNGAAAMTWLDSPMYQAYAAAAPNPADWPKLADRLSHLLRQEYDWMTAVSALPTPMQIIVGDADGVRLTHAVELFALRGGGLQDGGFVATLPSQLAVLPATTHLGMMDRFPHLAPTITAFLDATHANAQ